MASPNPNGTSNFNILATLENLGVGLATGQAQAQAVTAGYNAVSTTDSIYQLASGVAPAAVNAIDHAGEYALRALEISVGVIVFFLSVVALGMTVAGQWGTVKDVAVTGGKLITMGLV